MTNGRDKDWPRVGDAVAYASSRARGVPVRWTVTARDDGAIYMTGPDTAIIRLRGLGSPPAHLVPWEDAYADYQRHLRMEDARRAAGDARRAIDRLCYALGGPPNDDICELAGLAGHLAARINEALKRKEGKP